MCVALFILMILILTSICSFYYNSKNLSFMKLMSLFLLNFKFWTENESRQKSQGIYRSKKSKNTWSKCIANTWLCRKCRLFSELSLHKSYFHFQNLLIDSHFKSSISLEMVELQVPPEVTKHHICLQPCKRLMGESSIYLNARKTIFVGKLEEM